MSLCKGPLFAPIASKIHSACFDRGWTEKEFSALLNLPTSKLWMNETALLLCAHVADEMEILTICVLPQVRRQHQASDLLMEMFSYAKEKKVKKIFLEVAQDNLPAQKLYASFNFIQTGRRSGYYSRRTGNVDALCLTKKM